MLVSAPMNLHEFLVSPVAYLAPEKVLEGLSAADAERRLPGDLHSVAEIVAHLTFWEGLVLRALYGQGRSHDLVRRGGLA